MVAELVSVQGESVQPACETVFIPVMQVMRRAKTRPRLKHTAKSLNISPPSISADMLTIAVCTHADSAECDPGFQETDIDGDKVSENIDDCGDCSVFRTETICV